MTKKEHDEIADLKNDVAEARKLAQQALDTVRDFITKQELAARAAKDNPDYEFKAAPQAGVRPSAAG